jgi:hypothetical protein
MLLETLIAISQPTPEFGEIMSNHTQIIAELQSSRRKFFLARANKLDNLKPKTQTIEIPDGYILCPKDYVCIPKEQYVGQPVPPSTVNQVPQATIVNPNLNQPLPQSINQINQNLNPGIGQFNNQQNGSSIGVYPNQGINPSTGQPGGIGIGQQNNGNGFGGNFNGSPQPGKINTNINLGINIGVSW